MAAKTKAQQDDAAGPLTRHIRSAQLAQDKIAQADADPVDKMLALGRIEQYGGVVMARVLKDEQDAEHAKQEGGEL